MSATPWACLLSRDTDACSGVLSGNLNSVAGKLERRLHPNALNGENCEGIRCGAERRRKRRAARGERCVSVGPAFGGLRGRKEDPKT